MATSEIPEHPISYPSYYAPEREPKFWHFVGECGLGRKGGRLTESTDEYVFWLRMGIAFLLHTFGEPPSDCKLDVLWAKAPHGEGDFPIIAVGFNNQSDSAAASAYAHSLEKDLLIFDGAVDWRAIASNPSSPLS